MNRELKCPEKDDIRREIRARRMKVSDSEKHDAAASVCAKLIARTGVCGPLDQLGGIATIAVYLASPNEIDIGAYIRQMLEFGARVVAPRWNGETYELSVLKGLDMCHLRRGPMGIMEPADRDVVAPHEVSIWIVPGLAFTRDGWRVGYGGGWYDRLLAGASKDSVKLGVAYSFQIVESLPVEPHDIQLTALVDDSTP